MTRKGCPACGSDRVRMHCPPKNHCGIVCCKSCAAYWTTDGKYAYVPEKRAQLASETGPSVPAAKRRSR